MRLVYASTYRIQIGPHVFPTAKYALVVERLLADARIRPDDIVPPVPASWEDLELVHTRDYLTKVRNGTLSAAELAQIDIPWSEAVVEGFRLMTGGTLVAARLAIADGLGGHIGGGFHHAFASHGEGFCLFNDVAVAVRVLQRDGVLNRACVIDLDVHHGNGTAMIFERDDRVFTFSMHQQHNYPMFKPRGSLDIGLPDATEDGAYLEALNAALPDVLAARPDIIFYLAGADPYRDDQLGGLDLTQEGLARRDALVLETVRTAGVPMVVTLAGGYARNLADTVEIHVGTVSAALNLSRAS